MRKRTITVQDRQTLLDVAIREYGSVEALFELLSHNPQVLGPTAHVYAGDLLKVAGPVLDASVVAFFTERGRYPVSELPPPPPPPFVCAGEGLMSMQTLGPGNLDELLLADTSTGYIAIRNSDGTVTVFGSGTPFSSISCDLVIDGSVQSWCVWSSNESGEEDGYISSIGCTGFIASVSPGQLSGLDYLFLYENSLLTTLDVSGMPSLTYVEVENAPLLTTVNTNDSPLLGTINLPGCALSQATVNALVVAASLSGVLNGTMILTGGTSATPDGTVSLEEGDLNTKGWDLQFNP